MLSVKRLKRDTAENLYKQCQLTGNCLPDVVNKVENKTWADTLLQIFSSVLYLGNLGIGTGKTSPTVGSRVVAGGVRVPETIAPTTTVTRSVPPRQQTPRPTRPFSVPLDPIGAGSRPIGPRLVDPSGLRPVDVIDPTSPSIVTLNETLPDNVVTTGNGTIPDLDIVTDTTSINSHPTVLQTPELELAVLNVTPADPPPTRVLFTNTTYNPAYSVETTVGHINPEYDVIVNPFITTETITFGEDIPLEPINPRQEFDIENVAKTSTPRTALQRTVSRFRQLYNRTTEQVPTRNVNLLGDVSRAIQFGFENPAFDPEVSLEFEEDLSSLQAAPDPDFTNIRRIGRPILSETPQGTVRVSRLGTRAGVRTRSGTVGAQKVHFYYDVSRIEEIELPTLSTKIPKRDPVVIKTTIVDAANTPINETDLLDDYAEQFNNAHLVFTGTEDEDETAFLPIYSQVFTGFPFTYGRSTASLHPYYTVETLPASPILPGIFENGISVDFDLHPSLLPRRKRKRSNSS